MAHEGTSVSAVCISASLTSLTPYTQSIAESIASSSWPKYSRNASEQNKGKGNAVQLQARSGQERSTKLRFPDFVTTAQNGGKVVRLIHRPPLINQSHNRPEVPRGFQEVKDPRFRDNGTGWW